jgi:hypothetical protein
MAKSSIRKTDPTDTTAPAKRRRTTAPDNGQPKPAVKAGPRVRRKDDTPVATAVVEAGTNGHVESILDVPHEQIAIRAYHIYLERGYPGDSFHDWVTAERELREQITRARG